SSAEELVSSLPLPVRVAELGSGSGSNTRILLQTLAAQQYVRYYPIDISARALDKCRQELGSLDSVEVTTLQLDYLVGLSEVCFRRGANETLLVLFLGSTIGNFERAAAATFLKQIRALLQPGDALLLAADLQKPVDELLSAYDDPLGVTAAFNLNLLSRIN